MKLETFSIVSKNTQISNFVKIRPVGAELFHANGRRSVMTKLTAAFRNFVNAPKMITFPTLRMNVSATVHIFIN